MKLQYKSVEEAIGAENVARILKAYPHLANRAVALTDRCCGQFSIGTLRSILKDLDEKESHKGCVSHILGEK